MSIDIEKDEDAIRQWAKENIISKMGKKGRTIEIHRAVLDYFDGVTLDIQGERKLAKVTHARQAFVYVARKFYGIPAAEAAEIICRESGYLDGACKSFARLIERNTYVAHIIKELEQTAKREHSEK